jgi:hypothetical protein
LPVIAPLRRRSDTLTGTLVRSAGSSLCFEAGMTDIDQAHTQEETARIREFNDQLRISHTGGTLVITPGVLALGIYLNQAILIAIAAYDDFDEDSDPSGEHDFGLLEIAEQEVLFKIDY